MYKYIINPETGRKVLSNGVKGKHILRNYIKVFNGGSQLENKEDSQLNKSIFNSQHIRWSSSNGIVTENTNETINLVDGKGKYTKKEFGKTIKNEKITKKDLENFIQINGLNVIISDDIFKRALNIFNNTLTDIHKTSPSSISIQPAIEDKKNINLRKNKINNNSPKQKKGDKCKDLQKKYKLKTNIKNDFKEYYSKEVKKFNPKKCKDNKCKKKYDELNSDYDYYMNNC